MNEKLSPHQINVLHLLSRRQGDVQLAGANSAHWVSVGKSLVRRGLAWSIHSGKFRITDEGRKALVNWKAAR